MNSILSTDPARAEAADTIQWTPRVGDHGSRAMEAPTRSKVLDAVRGLLILYIVVVIHSLFWLNLLPEVLRSLLLFEMPAIFIASGYAYGLYEAASTGRQARALDVRGYCRFLGVRAQRILLPYLTYAAFCIVMIYSASRYSEYESYAFSDVALSWLNPFSYGVHHSVGWLNSHLWFIRLFLLVNLAMPLVTKLRPFRNPPLLGLAIVATAGLIVLTHVHFAREGLVKEFIFYLMFALLGYYLATRKEYFRRSNIRAVSIFAATSLTCIVIVAIVQRDIDIVNMQLNKFPPNYIFFLFTVLWISFFLGVLFKNQGFVARLEHVGESAWLRPFVSYGYSIYLWQGAAYTAAFYVGTRMGLPSLAIGVLAVALSVGLGRLASPVEKVRWI